MVQLAAQLGFVAMAVLVFSVAVQGFRGVPDTNGKKTSKGVAVVCLIPGVGMLVLAFVVVPGQLR